jgi:hypothetical protein
LHSEIDADFESAEKVVQKIMGKKLSTKNDRKMEFFDFLLSAKVFG